MSLVIDEHGSFIGKRGRSIYIKTPNGNPARRSTYNLTELVIMANCSISSQAIQLMSQNGIPIVMIKAGRSYAVIHPFFNHGTVHTRREQLAAYWDERGGKLASSFTVGAIMNKQRILQYWSRNRKESSLETAEELSRLAAKIGELPPLLGKIHGTPDDVRLDLMNIEAQAARYYFLGLQTLIPEEFGFNGREKRPSRDPVNSMLSYGYAILYSRVLTSIAACGLEPFAGFLHADRSGKPSLVLDMVEEFRQPTIDRTVMRLLSQRQVSIDGFEKDGSRLIMNQKTRRSLIAAIIETLDMDFRLGRDKSLPLSQLIMKQGRMLVRFLLGKIPEYKPYIFRW